LAKELEISHTSLTATRDKLTIKSTALDTAVIQKNEAKIQVKRLKRS
jgi:hypothetical protein